LRACDWRLSWTIRRNCTAPAICRATIDAGITGFLAHEFVPTRALLTSLREAVVLCDV
jgi:hypothetical protein